MVAPWIYPLFNRDNQGSFGGWEVRVSIIAKGLAERGNFQVNILAGDHGQPHLAEHGKIKFYAWSGRQIWGIPPQVSKNNKAGVASSRFKRLFVKPLRTVKFGNYLITPEMISIYDEINADIYTVPGNSQFSGELAYFCKQRNKKFVFLAGSDMDYYPEYKLQPDKLDIYSTPFSLKAYAIENADAHIVQNERQAEMLRNGYNRFSTLIKNPIDINPMYDRDHSARTILWVGKSDERVKQPSLLFELARRLPDYKFVVIMNIGLPETHTQCLETARTLPNVELIERVPFEKIEKYFASARVHVSTSAFEGFPNTFLQAAKYGVPTISVRVDPDGMLSQHECGISCGGDFEKFNSHVRVLLADDSLYARFSQKSLAYLRNFHDKDMIIPMYEKVLDSVL